MKSDAPKVPQQAKADRWCNKPTQLQFELILTQTILLPSKRYKSTEGDRKTWLHVPSGTLWSTNSDTHKVVEILKETSTKMYTPF